MAAKESKKMVVYRYVKRGAIATRQSGGHYLLAGALLMLVANSDFLKNHPMVRATWWLVPVGLIIAGLVARKKGSKYAPALLVAGAMLLVQTWQAQPKAGTAPAQAPPKPGDTKGPTEFVANGSRIRINSDGSLEMMGETGSPANANTVRNMADAVYGRRAA